MKTTFLLLCLCLHVSLMAQVSLIKKDVTCKGRNDGSIEVVVEGIDGPFIYQWSNGFRGKKASGLKPGDYSVTVSTASGCMDTKAAKIYDGPEMSVSISARLLNVSPKPVPCGTRPTFTYQLTAIPHGGTPPYYCSWGRLDPGNGDCQIVVSGKSIRASVFMSDDNTCGDAETWEKEGVTKMCPKDPNDMSGPDGYSTERWMSVHDDLDYTIRFENDPDFATSSASVVLITVPIDDDIDPFSFRLASMGFGNKIIEIPENSSYYQQRLDYSADLGVMVDVTAGLDLPNSRFFWLLETIDPLTGQAPTDPNAGFLPVNDTLTGSGEGFVNFICKAKPTTPTGEIISHHASIIFDLNDPIPTNIWDNKIDALPPVTNADALPDTFYSNNIPFHWLVQDDPGGCGVQHTQIFLSTDAIDFETNGFLVDTSASNIVLNWDTKYYYRVLSSDNVNNLEEHALDSFYIIPQRTIEFITPDQDNYCLGDTLYIDIDLVSIPDVDLFISIDSGMTYSPLANHVSEWPYALVLGNNYIHPYIFIKAKNEAANLETISDPFAVRQAPVVDAGMPIEGCDNETLFVSADGANVYRWSPENIFGSPDTRYSNVYADSSQYAYVIGTDAYGCSAIDSVFLNIHPHSSDTIVQGLCQGDSVLINGNWISAEGFYPVIFSNTHGCDSIITSHVLFQNPCIWQGGPYVFVDQDAAGANDGTSWTNAFPDLQDAIYVAGRYENVQEIWVAEGVYLPHAMRRDTSFVLRDSIKIYGGFLGVESTRAQRTADAALVELSGDINVADTLWDNSYHTLVLSSTCKECVLDGLTIKYGYADQLTNSNDLGAGILNYGNGKLYNVILERNYATDQGAALYSSGTNANLIIENCVFRFNSSSFGRDVMNISGAQMEFRGLNAIH